MSIGKSLLSCLSHRYIFLCLNNLFNLQENGKVFYSADANFGLVCKKSAGKSREPPKRSNEIFISDSEVDGYIGNCNDNVQKDELVSLSSKRFYVYIFVLQDVSTTETGR